MDNNKLPGQLAMLAKLMDIHGKDRFKSKAYFLAAYNIQKNIVQLTTLSKEKIFSMQGIGHKYHGIIKAGKNKSVRRVVKKTTRWRIRSAEYKRPRSKKKFQQSGRK